MSARQPQSFSTQLPSCLGFAAVYLQRSGGSPPSSPPVLLSATPLLRLSRVLSCETWKGTRSSTTPTGFPNNAQAVKLSYHLTRYRRTAHGTRNSRRAATCSPWEGRPRSNTRDLEAWCGARQDLYRTPFGSWGALSGNQHWYLCREAGQYNHGDSLVLHYVTLLSVAVSVLRQEPKFCPAGPIPLGTARDWGFP